MWCRIYTSFLRLKARRATVIGMTLMSSFLGFVPYILFDNATLSLCPLTVCRNVPRGKWNCLWTFGGSFSCLRLKSIFSLLSCLSVRLDGPEILDQGHSRVSQHCSNASTTKKSPAVPVLHIVCSNPEWHSAPSILLNLFMKQSCFFQWFKMVHKAAKCVKLFWSGFSLVLIVYLSGFVQSWRQHQNLPLDVSEPHQKEKALALYVSVTKF